MVDRKEGKKWETSTRPLGTSANERLALACVLREGVVVLSYRVSGKERG